MVSKTKVILQVLMCIVVATTTAIISTKLTTKEAIFEFQAEPQEIAFISSLAEFKNRVESDTAILTSHVRTRLKLDEKAVISYDMQRGVFTVNK